MIAYVDAMVGQLLDALDETGLADDTAVFLFSDHGEWAGDYGLVEKWHACLDDCLTHVPLIARIPGGTCGHVVNTPVECFDIMPTTLALAGIAAAHTHFARSLVPQLHGAPGDPERAVFAEGGYDTHEPHCYEGAPDMGRSPDHIYYPKGRLQQEHPETSVRCTMVRTGNWKLVYRPEGVSELYDLSADPLELANLYGQPETAEAQKELQVRLLDWYVHTSDVVPFPRQSRGFEETVRRRLAADAWSA
jgi:choline-sulfatase